MQASRSHAILVHRRHVVQTLAAGSVSRYASVRVAWRTGGPGRLWSLSALASAPHHRAWIGLMVVSHSTELAAHRFARHFAVTGGAVGAFGAYLPSFYVFFFAIAVAPTVWLFAQGDAFHALIGGLFVLWFPRGRRAGAALEPTVRRVDPSAAREPEPRRRSASGEVGCRRGQRGEVALPAAASHDLRQPVHALSLFVSALRVREMDVEARGLLDHIDTSVRALGGCSAACSTSRASMPVSLKSIARRLRSSHFI